MRYTHVLTLKDGKEYYLSAEQAKAASSAIDAKRNFYLQADYLNYFTVMSIRQVVSPTPQLSAGDMYCGNCERGWLISKDGARPCTCNQEGIEAVRDYAEELKKAPGSHPEKYLGENNDRAVLNWEKVNAIRFGYSIGETMLKLAKHYGVSESTVYNVIKGDTWKIKKP